MFRFLRGLSAPCHELAIRRLVLGESGSGADRQWVLIDAVLVGGYGAAAGHPGLQSGARGCGHEVPCAGLGSLQCRGWLITNEVNQPQSRRDSVAAEPPLAPNSFGVPTPATPPHLADDR